MYVFGQDRFLTYYVFLEYGEQKREYPQFDGINDIYSENSNLVMDLRGHRFG